MRKTRLVLVAVVFALAGLALFRPAAPLGADGGYTIAQGDTLSEIAERFGVSVEALAEANGVVEPDLILSGDVLLIPAGRDRSLGGGAPVGWTPGGGTYSVQFGDTLSEIAERFGVPMIAIVEANGLTDPHFIVEGQTLTIPVVTSPLVPPVVPEMEALLDRFAAAEGLDPGILKAVAYIESGWQQGVVSRTGAVGVMQIQPSTGYWLERDVFGFDLDIEMSAYDNIRAGARYLRLLVDLTGDTDQAVAAYYQGYATISVGAVYEDTIRYVADVNAIADRFGR